MRCHADVISDDSANRNISNCSIQSLSVKMPRLYEIKDLSELGSDWQTDSRLLHMTVSNANTKQS